MKNIFFALFAAAAICAGGKIFTLRADEVISVSDSCRAQGDTVTAAIVYGDYAKFAQAANENKQDGKRFAENRAAMIRSFGNPVGYRFLTYLQTPLVVNQIWLIDFVKTTADGKEIRRQQLLQLIFGKRDQQMRLIAMRLI